MIVFVFKNYYIDLYSKAVHPKLILLLIFKVTFGRYIKKKETVCMKGNGFNFIEVFYVEDWGCHGFYGNCQWWTAERR